MILLYAFLQIKRHHKNLHGWDEIGVEKVKHTFRV